jgi:hypothetical protein
MWAAGELAILGCMFVDPQFTSKCFLCCLHLACWRRVTLSRALGNWGDMTDHPTPVKNAHSQTGSLKHWKAGDQYKADDPCGVPDGTNSVMAGTNISL